MRELTTAEKLNRWKDLTPEQLVELRARNERRIDMPRTGPGPKVGPKEQMLRDQKAERVAESARAAKNHGMPAEKRKALLQSLAAEGIGQSRTPKASAPAQPQEPTMNTIKTHIPPTRPASAAAEGVGAAASTTKPPVAPKTTKAAKKPAKKAAAKPAPKTKAKPAKTSTKKVAGAVSKSDVVHRMLTAANGTTRELLSKATGWPSVNLTVATERAQKKNPAFRLVDADGRVRLTTDPK